MRPNVVVIFDLDDTLYHEIDYLKSAYKEISKLLYGVQKLDLSEEEIFNKMISCYNNGGNVFSEIITVCETRNYSVSDLIQLYRNHLPTISLAPEVENLLNLFKESNVQMGLITDGRSIQQRAKINALGLQKYLSHIIISEEFGSEKPNMKNYKSCIDFYNSKENVFYYVGDNINKDFITPNQLGWTSVCLINNGFNIHDQDIDVELEYKPTLEICKLGDLKDIICV
jgi:putative hydrolase of the HAD superfamily